MFRSLRGRIRGAGLHVSIEGLAREEDFARVLRRERDRADRTHDDFALVAVDVGALSADARWCGRFGRALEKRLRSTDEAGWLAPLRVGIALPHTDEAGAWAFIHALQAQLDPHRERTGPHFSVYLYSGNGGRGERNGRGGRRDDGARRDPQPIERALALEPLLLEPPCPWKRAMDVLLAGAGLIVAAPVIAASAAAVRCSSPGPAFFRQVRAGYGGRPFVLYKLRTMVEDAEFLKQTLAQHNEADGPVFKMSDDPRVTPVGRFLRRTSIDELPQLWNVLRGDMAMVGPRPPTFDEVECYATWQRRRLHAPGGLTCLWQVKGRSNIGFLDWMRLDLRYLRRRSLPFDMALVLRTIPAVLTGRGAK